MKFLNLTIATLLLSITAHASFDLETCSNSDATVKVTFDRGQQIVQLNYENYRPAEDKLTKGYVSIPNAVIEVVGTPQIITETTTPNCEGQPAGTGVQAIYKRVALINVQITRNNGRDFPRGTLIYQSDRKSIGTLLLCERNAGRFLTCEK
ncbi:MAG: hypothetical protein V4736_05395 [Bdellovibrionota bacterium]